MPTAGSADCGIAYCGLYRHASGATLFACIVGFAGALANAVVYPLFVLLFGRVRSKQSFGLSHAQL